MEGAQNDKHHGHQDRQADVQPEPETTVDTRHWSRGPNVSYQACALRPLRVCIFRVLNNKSQILNNK